MELNTKLFDFCYAGSNLPWTPQDECHIYPKTKLVSLICSNNTMTSGHIERINIAKSFEHKADCYGDLFNKRIGGSGHYHHNKKTDALKDYMFSITIENCIHDTYFTEKITDCFANGVIPIYRGTQNINRFFDMDGIIILDEKFSIDTLTPDLYFSKMQAIQNNFDAIQNMTNADDYLYSRLLNKMEL